MRAHFRAPIQDLDGNIQPGAVITLFQNGTTTPFVDPVYADATSTTLLGNPWTTPDGNIDFYLDIPQRVDLGIAPAGQSQVIIPDIDVEVSGTSSISLTFAGAGTSSTAVGNDATAAGDTAVSFGDSAQAGGIAATALGQGALANGNNSLAIGQAAQATGLQSTAEGASAQSTAAQATSNGYDSLATGINSSSYGANSSAGAFNSTALGNGASSTNTHSTAIGAGAATTENQQVMLGTVGDSVDVPNFLTLRSIPGGVKYRVYMTDAGVMYTRYHYPLDAANLLSGNDATFDAGLGTWAAGSNCTIAGTTAFTQGASAGAMLITQTAAGPAWAAPAIQPVSANNIYVGKIWMYRHAGDGSATQFQVWIAWFDGSNVIIGSALPGPPQTIVNDTWIAVDVRATAPSTAAGAALRCGVLSGGANGDKLYADTAGIFLAPAVI